MPEHIKSIEIILYVRDQSTSCRFYESLFRRKADLNVPGMTEFNLSMECKIGLMPNKGIAKILENKTPHPDLGNGIPRCELYLAVDDIQYEFDNATRIGTKLISPIMHRDWGDHVCYFADPDGHVIAFAEKVDRES
jgi:predicted enzyme related to lactoylglutathione lyase